MRLEIEGVKLWDFGCMRRGLRLFKFNWRMVASLGLSPPV